MSGFSEFALLLLLLAAVAAATYLMKNGRNWRPPWRKSKIKVLGKDKIIISAAAARNCPACKKALSEGALTAKCSANPTHEIHKACKALVNGKCPLCGHALA